MDVVQVALVGSNTLFLQGLRQILDSSRFVIAGEAHDFTNILQLVQKGGTPPALVIVDIGTHHEQDFEGIRRLREAGAESRIVMLASELNLSEMARALKAGADAYLVNHLSVSAFSLSLLLVMEGEKVLPGSLAITLATRLEQLGDTRLANGQRNLTDREQEILRCLQNGDSNKLIARSLGITEGTVKVHLKSLMKKIAANNRTQAALWARSHGIGETLHAPDPGVTPTTQMRVA